MTGIPIARLFGFEIRIHLSWAIILAVIVVTVVSEVEARDPSIAQATRWLIGGVIAAAFFLSALVHELAHAVVARRAGVDGGVLVVLFFGGTSSPGIEAPRPRDEIAIGLAGPLVSLAVGAVLVLIGLVTSDLDGPLFAAGQVALVVGVLNLLLGGVNLMPAYPLDGGRIVLGYAWGRYGDPDRGLRSAARTGRVLGWAVTALGLAAVVLTDPFNGIMLALLGWFLTTAARQVDRRATVDSLLEGVPASEVLEADAPEVSAGLTLDTFAGRMLDGTVSPSLPVMRDRELVGVVGASQLRRVRRQRWTELRAEDLMIATDALPRVAPETSLRLVLDELRRSGLDGLPVVGAAGLAGIVTRRGVLEALKSRIELRGEPLL